MHKRTKGRGIISTRFHPELNGITPSLIEVFNADDTVQFITVQLQDGT